MEWRVLFESAASTEAQTLDIGFVHGLGGHPLETWQHPVSQDIWIRDFLPTRMPSIRVMTFGYNADAAFGNSTAGIFECAQSLLSGLKDLRESTYDRPLVFVAHSLGGILVKQALFQATIEQQYHSLRDATIGIIFFGTPHQGSNKANYAAVLANLAQSVVRRPKSKLLNSLRANSETLHRLTSDFRFQLPQYKIVSFYELRPMGPFSGLVVDKHSALLQAAHEDQIPLDANHSAMCKFEHINSDAFDKVCKRLERMQGNARLQSSDRNAAYNEHFLVLRLLSPIYTGQHKVTKLLEDSLWSNSQQGAGLQRRFVLHGLGGSGKTQICINYAQTQRNRYWGVFWIDAGSNDSIKTSFVQIAEELNVKQDSQSARLKLANEKRPWLLVFDNADSSDVALAPYFPPGDRGHLIITSRDPESRQYSSMDGFHKIGPMMAEESLDLFHKATRHNTLLSQEYIQDSQCIVDLLGCLPLAIVQAGSYIREACCSPKDYLQTYHVKWKELMNRQSIHDGTDYPYNAFTTWQISIDKIQSTRSTVSQQALDLLRCLSFYHHDQIPIAIFQQPSETALESQDWTELHLAITLLSSFSLVTKNNNNTISLHPFVHRWCFESADDEYGMKYRKAASMLVKSAKLENNEDLTDEEHNWIDRKFIQQLLPHALECLRHCPRTVDFDLDVKPHWSVLASILHFSGWTVEAMQLEEQVVRQYEEHLGVTHDETWRAKDTLAHRYSDAGEWAAALTLAESVVQRNNESLGESHAETIQTTYGLASLYLCWGRQCDALPLTEYVVKSWRQERGETDPDTLRAMRQLADINFQLERPDVALKLTEHVVFVQKETLGEDHLDTIASELELANLYDDFGRQTSAISLTERVVERLKQNYGKHDYETLGAMTQLATLWSQANQRGKALCLAEEVLAIHQQEFGEINHSTQNSMCQVAQLYAETGQEYKGLELLKRVIELRTAKLGKGHPDTLQSMADFAGQTNRIGRPAEAVSLMEEVVLSSKKTLGAFNETTLHWMSNLVRFNNDADRPIQALGMAEQVAKLQRDHRGLSHPDTLDSLMTLAHQKHKTGAWREAVQIAGRVAQVQKEKLGETHPDTLYALESYSLLSESLILKEKAIQQTGQSWETISQLMDEQARLEKEEAQHAVRTTEQAAEASPQLVSQLEQPNAEELARSRSTSGHTVQASDLSSKRPSPGQEQQSSSKPPYQRRRWWSRLNNKFDSGRKTPHE